MKPVLEQLRAEVRALERGGMGHEEAATLPVGVADLDAALGGGLALGGVSELVPSAFLDEPAVLSFSLALVARAMAQRQGDVVVVEDGSHARAWGRLYGPGLQAMGVAPSRVLIVSARDTKQAHACLEDCARTTGLACVLALIGPKSGFDLVGARRVQLAAEQGRALVMMVASLRTPAFAPARARLRIAARASVGRKVPGASLPLLGPPAWTLTLERTRTGARPQNFQLEYDHETHHLHQPTALPHRPNFAGFRQAG